MMEDRKERAALVLVNALFLLSGATGLVYEVTWARMLTQIFGNTTHAIATVLSAFMAGLALGSWVFGRLADRRARFGLVAYGLLEGGIGVYGLLVPAIFGLLQRTYVALHGLGETSSVLHALALFAIAFVALVIPTALMGATLPVLSKFTVEHLGAVGRRVADLYAFNTLGAVLGCVLAGFVLIPELGLTASTRLAAAVNGIIAVAILGMASRLRTPEERSAASAPPVTNGAEVAAAAPAPVDLVRLRAVLCAFALSGAAAMILENAWTRALTLVIGTSTYSFTVMLGTFLTGLAVGSFVYARAFAKHEPTLRTFGAIELLVALASLATIPLFERLPLIFFPIVEGSPPFEVLLGAQVVLSALVILGPTLFLGATFPVAARLATRELSSIGRSVGDAYAANTVGAIVGAFLGGFVLIPAIGIQSSIGAAVLLAGAGGVGLVALDATATPRARGATAALAALAIAVALATFGSWDPALMTSGVVVMPSRRSRTVPALLRREALTQNELLSYREGLTATISVHRTGQGTVALCTNGKPDASTGLDVSTQLLLGYLPLLHAPEARRALVIGLGSGMTAKAMAAFPLEKLEVVEIEPAVVDAAREFFAGPNGRVLEDPRVRVVTTDGRNHVLAASEPWDVIVSEPSNPWIAGIGNLFTREFYRVARERLSESGVFGQWFHTYDMAPEDLRMVCATFTDEFPHATLWAITPSDLLLIGSKKPQRLDLAALSSRIARTPLVKTDLASIGFPDAASLLSLYVMPRDQLVAMSDRAPRNEDDLPRLEFSAPRYLWRRTSDLNWLLLLEWSQPPEVGIDWKNAPTDVLASRAAGYVAGKNPGQALAIADVVLEREPGNARALLARAEALLASGKHRDAVAALRALVALPAFPLADVVRLVPHLTPTEQVALLEKMRAARPAEKELLLLLVDALCTTRAYREAEPHLEEVAASFPKDGRFFFSVGRVLLAKGALAEALSAFAQVADLADRNGELHAFRGEALARLERWEDSAREFRIALRSDGSFVQWSWRFNLGYALARGGHKDEAARAFRETLAIDPACVQAWKALAELGERF